MPEKQKYSISELARQAGLTPRTIRYYTAEGLLPQPDTRGRYASYTVEHLERLRQITELKAQYLPLAVIRERLYAGEEPETPMHENACIHRGPSIDLSQTPPPAVALRPAPDVPDQRQGTHIRLEEAAERQSSPAVTQQLGNPLQLGHYAFFRDDPEPFAEADTMDSDGRPEQWQRFVLAPGVELSVRMPLSDRRRRQLAALIAAARDQLREEDGEQ